MSDDTPPVSVEPPPTDEEERELWIARHFPTLFALVVIALLALLIAAARSCSRTNDTPIPSPAAAPASAIVSYGDTVDRFSATKCVQSARFALRL